MGARFEDIPDAGLAVADTRRLRLLGLAWLERSSAPAALLIPRCRSVHTFGMRFALDLFWLDGEGRLVGLRRAVPPGRFASCRGGSAVLEVPAAG